MYSGVGFTICYICGCIMYVYDIVASERMYRPIESDALFRLKANAIEIVFSQNLKSVQAFHNLQLTQLFSDIRSIS